MPSSLGAVSSGSLQSLSGRSAGVGSSMLLEHSHKKYRDPWSYVEAQSKWVKSKTSLDDEKKDWASTSHLMYAHFEVDEQGIVGAVERSAITGFFRSVTLQSAHLVSFAQVKWLIDAKVVPTFADVNCDANRINMETHYHAAFDAGRLRLIPDANLVLVRLMNEIKYQEARLATLEGERTAAVVVPQKRGLPDDPGESASPFAHPPVRPDFQDFYETLERMGAVFRLFGTIDILDPLVRPREG